MKSSIAQSFVKLKIFFSSHVVFFFTFQTIPLLLAIGEISAQCLTGNDVPSSMNPATKTSLTDARFDFALDSMKKAALLETRDNIFFSPHSVHQALSLAYFGARGTTEEALKRALRIPNELSKVDVQRYYAFERSLSEMRSQVSNSGAIVQFHDLIYNVVAEGMSRQIVHGFIVTSTRLDIPKVLTNATPKLQMLGEL